MGSGQWEVIALNLGLGINAIDQIKEDSRKNVARLARAIDAWIKEAKERNDATVKRLLNACDSSGIGSRAIEQKLKMGKSDFTSCVTALHFSF